MDELVLVAGEGPGRTGEDLDRRLSPLLEAGPSQVVVDLSAVGRLSSGAVAALLRIHRRCRERGVDVVLRHPPRGSIDMLRRTGLLAALSVEDR